MNATNHIPAVGSAEGQAPLIQKAAGQILQTMGSWANAGLNSAGVAAAFCMAVSDMDADPNTAEIARIIRVKLAE